MDGESRKFITRAGLFLAAALLLEYLSAILPRMPQGGKISLGMIPLIIFSLIYGWKRGILVGIAFSFLYMIIDLYIVHPAQLILDYPLAFGLVGLAGFFQKSKKTIAIYFAILTACFGRFIAHYISGIVFFRQIAKGASPEIYSLIYNASYMIPTLMICLVTIPPLYERIRKRITGEQPVIK